MKLKPGTYFCAFLAFVYNRVIRSESWFQTCVLFKFIHIIQWNVLFFFEENTASSQFHMSNLHNTISSWIKGTPNKVDSGGERYNWVVNRILFRIRSVIFAISVGIAINMFWSFCDTLRTISWNESYLFRAQRLPYNLYNRPVSPCVTLICSQFYSDGRYYDIIERARFVEWSV